MNFFISTKKKSARFAQALCPETTWLIGHVELIAVRGVIGGWP